MGQGRKANKLGENEACRVLLQQSSTICQAETSCKSRLNQQVGAGDIAQW
jgi:hypothetical protein